MMLALNGQPADVDAFVFVLAEKLGMTVGELEEKMSSREYVQWQAFFSSRAAVQSVHGV